MENDCPSQESIPFLLNLSVQSTNLLMQSSESWWCYGFLLVSTRRGCLSLLL